MSSDLHGASGDPSMEELILARSMVKMEFGNADESATNGAGASRRRPRPPPQFI